MSTTNRYNGFGLWSECPYPVRIAWGARAIIDKEGNLDFLPDRMDWNGTEAESRVARKHLADTINIAMREIRERVKDLMTGGRMKLDKPDLFTVFHEDKLWVLANTNGSCGYLYLVAYPPE